VPHTPGFPGKLVGVDELHATFLDETLTWPLLMPRTGNLGISLVFARPAMLTAKCIGRIESQRERAVVSHISRKTSEIWGTAHSSSKCNKISIALIRNKRNAMSEMGVRCAELVYGKAGKQRALPTLPQTRLLLLPSSPEQSRFHDLLHLEFVSAHPSFAREREADPCGLSS
jgi:hypothetical protein